MLPEEFGLSPDEPKETDWPLNYFNYFTEVEEHFQRARGTGLFLLSPLDWALIDTWRTAGVPLEAVLKGIEEAFEKWRSRKVKRRMVNSLAYCAQAVMECAARTPAKRDAPAADAQALFEEDQIAKHLRGVAEQLRKRSEPALLEIANKLEGLAETAAVEMQDLEALEQRLSALEEKILAVLRANQSDESLLAMRRSLDSELRPYRGKMTADQLAILERRYLDAALLEAANVSRLSLFYIH